ncbi:hypothetical protein B0T13DRAFT_447036 [Neurospora crassa]|nr:hypothetical protein B0T13DRAFT_447036 [Neurospora crassa]
MDEVLNILLKLVTILKVISWALMLVLLARMLVGFPFGGVNIEGIDVRNLMEVLDVVLARHLLLPLFEEGAWFGEEGVWFGVDVEEALQRQLEAVEDPDEEAVGVVLLLILERGLARCGKIRPIRFKI